jgi:hypothetical protein
LIEWLKEHGACDKCDDVIRDIAHIGMGKNWLGEPVGGLLHIVRCAQATEIQRIYEIVNEFIEKQTEEI